MDDERMRVLEMVAAGTVTAEQGALLLDALAPSVERSRRDEGRDGAHGRDDEPDEARDGRHRRVRTERTTRVRREKSRGSRGRANFDELITMAAVGVDADYLRSIEEAGLDLDLSEIVQLGAMRIPPQRVVDLMEAAGGRFGPPQVIKLAAMGVKPERLEGLWEHFGDSDDDVVIKVHKKRGPVPPTPPTPPTPATPPVPSPPQVDAEETDGE